MASHLRLMKRLVGMGRGGVAHDSMAQFMGQGGNGNGVAFRISSCAWRPEGPRFDSWHVGPDAGQRSPMVKRLHTAYRCRDEIHAGKVAFFWTFHQYKLSNKTGALQPF